MCIARSYSRRSSYTKARQQSQSAPARQRVAVVVRVVRSGSVSVGPRGGRTRDRKGKGEQRRREEGAESRDRVGRETAPRKAKKRTAGDRGETNIKLYIYTLYIYLHLIYIYIDI